MLNNIYWESLIRLAGLVGVFEDLNGYLLLEGGYCLINGDAAGKNVLESETQFSSSRVRRRAIAGENVKK
ncbi:MAG: hypothetical protein WD426_11675 [Anditalea sp.]